MRTVTDTLYLHYMNSVERTLNNLAKNQVLLQSFKVQISEHEATQKHHESHSCTLDVKQCSVFFQTTVCPSPTPKTTFLFELIFRKSVCYILELLRPEDVSRLFLYRKSLDYHKKTGRSLIAEEENVFLAE
jgi:hypothetical protein